jgi:hypothetical protein
VSKPLIDRIPFARILIGLTIVFVLSLGLCGLGFVSSWQGEDMPSRLSPLMSQAWRLDVLVMVLSALGVVVTGVAWVVAAIVGSSLAKASEPQNLFDEGDDTKLDKRD